MTAKDFEKLMLQNGIEIAILFNNGEIDYGIYKGDYDVAAQSIAFQKKDSADVDTVYFSEIEKIFKPDGSESK